MLVQDISSSFQKQSTAPQESVEEPVALPDSIKANREAYVQGEWRQQAYAARQDTFRLSHK